VPQDRGSDRVASSGRRTARSVSPIDGAGSPNPVAGIGGPCLVLHLPRLRVCVHWTFPAVGIGASIPVALLALYASGGLALPVLAWTSAAVAILVLVHEAGHALAARLASLTVTTILVTGGGGCCLIDDAPSPAGDLVFSAGGLLAQAALLAGTATCLWAFGAARCVPLSCAVIAFTGVNLAMLVFNAWPVAGSDGERIVRALHAMR
jgi:Zn-dependent protease